VEVAGYSVQAILFMGKTSLRLLQELCCDMACYGTGLVMENYHFLCDHVRTFHPDDFLPVPAVLCSSGLPCAYQNTVSTFRCVLSLSSVESV
jgi:hypothetical protein